MGGRIPPHLLPALVQNIESLRACWDRARKLHPTIGGLLRVRLLVRSNGRVSRLKVRHRTLPFSLLNCLRAQIRTWRFGRQRRPSRMRFPLIFPRGAVPR